MKRALNLLLIVTFAVTGLVLTASEGQSGEAKQALERALIGQWKVPKNRYKEKISFDFTQTRKFECVHEVPNREAVTWSGNWKVRTTTSGPVKAYLKARNQANPEKYMKAVVTADKALENFKVNISFNFKSADKSAWSSRLERASGVDDEDAEDEALEEDEEDEDFAEDEDTEEDEDEDLGEDEEDLEKDEE